MPVRRAQSANHKALLAIALSVIPSSEAASISTWRQAQKFLEGNTISLGLFEAALARRGTPSPFAPPPSDSDGDDAISPAAAAGAAAADAAAPVEEDLDAAATSGDDDSSALDDASESDGDSVRDALRRLERVQTATRESKQLRARAAALRSARFTEAQMRVVFGDKAARHDYPAPVQAVYDNFGTTAALVELAHARDAVIRPVDYDPVAIPPFDPRDEPVFQLLQRKEQATVTTECDNIKPLYEIAQCVATFCRSDRSDEDLRLLALRAQVVYAKAVSDAIGNMRKHAGSTRPRQGGTAATTAEEVDAVRQQRILEAATRGRTQPSRWQHGGQQQQHHHHHGRQGDRRQFAKQRPAHQRFQPRPGPGWRGGGGRTAPAAGSGDAPAGVPSN